MLVLCGGIYVVIRADEDLLTMHAIVLNQIDGALQEGDVSRAHHALDLYRQTYETTGSFENAVWQTHRELGLGRHQ